MRFILITHGIVIDEQVIIKAVINEQRFRFPVSFGFWPPKSYKYIITNLKHKYPIDVFPN